MIQVMGVGYTLSAGLKRFFSGKTKQERSEARMERMKQRAIEREAKVLSRVELERKVEAMKAGKPVTGASADVMPLIDKVIDFVKKNWYYLAGVAVLLFLIPKFAGKKTSSRRKSILARARAARAAKRKK